MKPSDTKLIQGKEEWDLIEIKDRDKEDADVVMFDNNILKYRNFKMKKCKNKLSKEKR